MRPNGTQYETQYLDENKKDKCPRIDKNTDQKVGRELKEEQEAADYME